MSRRDAAVYGPGGERYCPACGTRVAQQADNCFQCGTSLRARPRHLDVPVAEIFGLLLIAFLVWSWWQTRGLQYERLEAAFTATAEARVPLVRPATFTPTPTPSPTPTPTFTPTPTVTPTPTPRVYVVQPNDTLIALSIEFGVPVERLAQANGLSPSQGLRVGQRLIIPPPEGELAPTPTPTPRTGILNYTVQEGDTLVLVAERFQISVEALLKSNNLSADAVLKPGDVLIVPLATPEPTPTPTPFSSPTPTPGPPYPPPVPVMPPDTSTLDGETMPVRLAWTAVGYLQPGEVYRVTVTGAGQTWMFETRQNFLVLPADVVAWLRDGGIVQWQVQVVDITKRPPEPRSAPSPLRRFLIRSGPK